MEGFSLAPILAFFTWIVDAIKGVFVDVWEIIKDAFVWVLDQLLDLAISATAALDLSAIPALGPAINSLPPLALQVLGAVGLSQCLAIIVTALGIRLVMQLIPFVRLGS